MNRAQRAARAPQPKRRLSARRVSSACGPQQTFVRPRCACGCSAHRARRHPPGAHAVAVGAERRHRCDARAGVAPHNSLRSLRSLRSDRCGESVHEARAARAPTPALRFSPPQKSPLTGAAWREFERRWRACFEVLGASAKARAGSRWGACAQPRSGALVTRARSALRALTCRICPNAANGVSAVSYAAGSRDRASQGTRAQRGQAVAPRRLSARAFARANARTRTAAPSREEPLAIADLMRRESSEARCRR